MIGSQAVGGWVAQIVFWILIPYGVVSQAIGRLTAAGFLVTWAAGYLALPRIAWWTGALVTPYVARLDIALVFLVFKGDVKLL